MGAGMSRHEEIDDVTGMSVAEMEAAAEDLYQHRDLAIGDEVPAEPAAEIRSVVSVRFSRGELDEIAAAAAAVGQPLSTYIRNAALAAGTFPQPTRLNARVIRWKRSQIEAYMAEHRAAS